MARKDTLLAGFPEIGRGPKVKAGGLSEYFGPDGRITEMYASTCAHCQSITEFESRRTMMEKVEVCRGCMKLICLNCYGKPCIPAEKRAEFEELQARIMDAAHRRAWGCY